MALSNINGIDPSTLSTVQGMQPSDTVAPGGGLLSPSGESLLNNEVASASTTSNDTPALMNGVGANYSSGLLKDSPNSFSLGMNPTGDITSALNNQALSKLGSDVSNIGIQTGLNAPVRLAQRQATAAGGLAEDEQIRFNNWSLQNTWNLQAAQLQAAQNAAQASFLSSLLGLGGTIAGAGIGALAGNPAAGALIGSKI
jgi:hypothetical protein